MSDEYKFPIAAEDLVELVKVYEPDPKESLIIKAYEFAQFHHRFQQRSSGEPYFVHPLEVARIATTWKLDSQSIITALLHDTVEDTAATLPEIEKEFGPEVARLVDGVTKLNSIEINPESSEKSEQAENLRKLVLAMSMDVRVLLIKLMDRLHNMRTLKFLKSPEKMRRKALETQEIYAPLAQRIGMQSLYDELSNICFEILHPEIYEAIERRKKHLFTKDKAIVSRVIQELQQVISSNSIRCYVSGREKATYSIWKKMQSKNLPFEQLSDIFAYRILVESTAECYQVLGILHSTYPVVPGRFKDYISTPKSNSYQSLHTCIIGPFGYNIEVQIRTQQMHEVNEMGVAAHWEYKQGKGDKQEKSIFKWIRELVDILEHSNSPEEFLEHTKMEMYQDKVFCFTPAGDIISLPHGATPVDFAYAIHSAVGNHCVGCKVNGRMMPLRVELKNGDQVEIITAKNQTPSMAWERFVITGKAKSAIRRFIREQQREEYAQLGKNMLKVGLKAEKLELTHPDLRKAARYFRLESPIDLFTQVGMGLLSSTAVLDFFRTLEGEVSSKKDDAVAINAQIKAIEKLTNKKHEKTSSVAIRGLIPGMALHYAKCCHPLPGEPIVGIISTGRGVKIHKNTCPNLSQFAEQPEKWIDVEWGGISDYEHSIFDVLLRVVVENRSGALAVVSAATSRLKANIDNLKVTKRDAEHCDLLVELQVNNADQLNRLMMELKGEPLVMSVERI
jgi:GTP diphosphokinase / guanosine-3',5'-bis(diphosphate) 3'-diphosphatase